VIIRSNRSGIDLYPSLISKFLEIMEGKSIEELILSIIVNSVKLLVTLAIIYFIIPILIPLDITILETEFILIRVREFLNVCSLLFIIYYGYYILRDLKVVFDRAVDSLISKFGIAEKRPKLRRAGMDLVWIIGLFLAYAALMQVLSMLISIPSWASLLVRIVFTALILVLIYDFTRTLYLVGRSWLKKLAEMIASRIRRATE